MKKTLECILGLLILITTTAQAQQLPADQEQLLVPIAPDRILGAFGSTWDTSLAIANVSDVPVTVWVYPPFCNILCSSIPEPIPARATMFIGTVSNRCTPAVGQIFISDRTSAENLFFTLRSRDTSRDAKAWGSIVPVVRTRDRFSRPFSIVDVPVSSGLRSLLRLYSMNAAGAASVRVRFYAVDPNAGTPFVGSTFIAEIVPTFVLPPTESAPYCPAYAEIALWREPSLQNASRIRVDVVPGDSVQQYWGFVSVTNNDTQEVSILTPR